MAQQKLACVHHRLDLASMCVCEKLMMRQPPAWFYHLRQPCSPDRHVLGDHSGWVWFLLQVRAGPQEAAGLRSLSDRLHDTGEDAADQCSNVW